MAFELTRIGNLLKKLGKEAQETHKMNVSDVQLLIKSVNTFRTFLEGSNLNSQDLSRTSQSIDRQFSYGEDWKNIPELKGSSVQIGNIMIVASAMANNPEKAMAQYGDETTIRQNIVGLMTNLEKALIALLYKIKRKSAA